MGDPPYVSCTEYVGGAARSRKRGQPCEGGCPTPLRPVSLSGAALTEPSPPPFALPLARELMSEKHWRKSLDPMPLNARRTVAQKNLHNVLEEPRRADGRAPLSGQSFGLTESLAPAFELCGNGFENDAGLVKLQPRGLSRHELFEQRCDVSWRFLVDRPVKE